MRCGGTPVAGGEGSVLVAAVVEVPVVVEPPVVLVPAVVAALHRRHHGSQERGQCITHNSIAPAFSKWRPMRVS